MAKLTPAKRKAMPKTKFGLPTQKKYPMPDASHAGNAKARASQQVGKTITPVQEAMIDRKANKILKG